MPLAPPLLIRPGLSQVSDLIVGIVPEPGLLPDDMPVPLLPTTRLWRDDLLRVYFEIYHPVAAAEEETRQFEIRLQTFRRSDDPLDDGEPEAGTAAIVVSLESAPPTGRHHFDLDLRNEESGALEVVLAVTDTVTDETYVRTAAVLLLDS